MRKAMPLLLLGTMLSTHALALDVCKVSGEDPQVRICTYSPFQRYAVNGVVGYPVNLSFGETEHIKRTEFAYTGLDDKGKPSETWRGPAKKADDGSALPVDRFKTNLPIWPFQAGHSALVVVTQLPDGGERVYQFDLNAVPDPVGNTTSALSFSYPTDVRAAASKAAAEKQQAAVAVWRKQQADKREAEAIARLKTDVFYGQRNWAYQAKADPRFKFLQPKEISDNGWLTEMQWPANVQLPAISILDPVTGDERTAPVSQQDSMQIIATTAEWFRLRLGKEAVMDVHNLAWKAERPDAGTGTTSSDVVRAVTYKDGK